MARYRLYLVEDADLSGPTMLGQVVGETETRAAAKTLAEQYAGQSPFGTAIEDTETGEIDWGDDPYIPGGDPRERP